MIDEVKHRHGVHRYRNVTDGVAMVNEFLSSCLSVSEFARQKGVSFKMVKYWCARARQLAAAASASAPPPMRPGHATRISKHVVTEYLSLIAEYAVTNTHLDGILKGAHPPLKDDKLN